MVSSATLTEKVCMGTQRGICRIEVKSLAVVGKAVSCQGPSYIIAGACRPPRGIQQSILGKPPTALHCSPLHSACCIVWITAHRNHLHASRTTPQHTSAGILLPVQRQNKSVAMRRNLVWIARTSTLMSTMTCCAVGMAQQRDL